jgi:hypothetical protein
MRLSELEPFAENPPARDTRRVRVIGLPHVALAILGIYLFGLLTASTLFDPTGGKLGALWRAPRGNDQFVGETVWALQEPVYTSYPKWMESMIYWLETFVFGEDLLGIPT